MIRTALRPHQVEAVARAIPHDGFAFFPEPRCGKTLISLTLVDHRRPTRLLILCPEVAIAEWQRQIPEHTDFQFPVEIQILTFQSAIQRARRSKLNRWLEKDSDNAMVIIDEAHRIKSRAKTFARTAHAFGRRAKWRLILTGTPIAQGRHDAFSLMKFIDPELFGEYDFFKDRYLIMGGYMGKKVVGFRNEGEFDRIFHSRCYRITFKETLGGKTFLIKRTKLWCSMIGEAERHYLELEQELITYVNQKKVTVPRVIQKTMKLQQLAGGFLIDEDKEAHLVGYHKRDKLQDWMRKTHDGSPFVLVCRFLHEIRWLEAFLTEMGKNVQVICGGRRIEDPEWDVVILQVQSGLAIDLSRAKTVVFFSWDYSFINYEQTRFRVLSHDQTSVQYVFLMTHRSIDELLYEVVTRKKKLATTVCDHYRRA